MNTDDERREEYTRKVALSGGGKGQDGEESLMSRSDLLNVLNGSVLCMFEPTDLNDLRRENSIQFCSFFTRSKACRGIGRRLSTLRLPFLNCFSAPASAPATAMTQMGMAHNRREARDGEAGSFRPSDAEEIVGLNSIEPAPKTAPIKGSTYSIESLNQSGANMASQNLLSANKTVCENNSTLISNFLFSFLFMNFLKPLFINLIKFLIKFTVLNKQLNSD